MLRLQCLTLLAALSPFTLAYPLMAVTGAGSSLPAAAPITVTWTDTSSPANSLLSTFTMTLYVGGNQIGVDAVAVGPVLTAAGSVAAGSYSATLTPATLAAAGNTPNGFYFQMISVVSDGGTVITYSPRFGLAGMTGVTPAAQIAAAAAVGTAVPAAVPPAADGDGAATGTTAGEGMFGIPYQSQTGLTKYAPMQALPPTKITAKTYTPLYPTSALSIATTWLPIASLLTTMTQPVTYSFSSMENTAAAQAQPSGDMAKFLARWKD